MNELNKLDKYFITPNPRFYGGFKYDGNDIKLCDDTDTDDDYKFHVVQVIENDVLKTTIEKEYKMKNKHNVKENSYMEIEIEKDQLLVYVEGQGFVIPEYRMNTLEEVVNIYEIMKGEENDTSRIKEEGTSIN